MENGKVPEGFTKAQRKAESIADDPSKVKSLLDKTLEKIKDVGDDNEVLSDFVHSVKTFVRLLSAFIKGDYREVSKTTMVIVLGGLVYFISPLDFIPDFIPIVGYLDDATVIVYIIKRIKNEIDKFEEWEASLV